MKKNLKQWLPDILAVVLFAVISFVLTYVLANPLINRFYKNNTLSFGKRLLWQTLIYFLILIMIMVLFTL
jgi:hypothetical protein